LEDGDTKFIFGSNDGSQAIRSDQAKNEHHVPDAGPPHLYCLNRGVLLTPFHTMLLVSPATSRDDITHLLHILEGAFAALIRGSAP